MPEPDALRDIQTCRDHHAVLRQLIARFPATGDDAGAVRTALNELRTVLLRHLAFEDNRLYPMLEGAPDAAVAEKARRYREEMGGLSRDIVEFLTRWTADAAIERDRVAFAQAWDRVRDALERRITAEDDDLYEAAEDQAR
ncbi:MAG: hypothetical protein JWO66_1020 [Candidatus Eremiobacteraeota bacterium]|jgi:hemerythrin-like domain-containing protein|nr:hypothetical protein [Candidatus Eremiobacteraeota bacterium]